MLTVKRVIVTIIAALLLCSAAMAERVVCADQGGVRVYIEDGRVGLMDSEGNALTAARFDEISPFDGDYAVAVQDGRQDVLRRDGSLAVDCAWGDVTVFARRGMARVIEDCGVANREFRLVDLATGKTLMDGEHRAIFYADDTYVYRLEFGYDDPWELAGPFVLTIHDGDLNPLLTLEDIGDAEPTGWGFVTCTEAVRWRPGSYGVVDLEGNALLEGVKSWCMDGENVCYVRRVRNPIRQTLEWVGCSRGRLKRTLKRRLGADEGLAHLLTAFMEDYTVCGILRPDGSRTELRGCELLPCGEGLYRVNARSMDMDGRARSIALPDGTRSRELYDHLTGRYDRWGYIDCAGTWVVSPTYDMAFDFVDGAAVVQKDGVYFLVDIHGRRVGDAEWAAGFENPSRRMQYAEALILARAEDGFLLVDRHGCLLTDEVFPLQRRLQGLMPQAEILDASMEDYEPYAENTTMLDMSRAALADSEGQLCVIDAEGRELLRMPAQDWRPLEAPDVLAVCVDGLWGVLEVGSENPGRWRVEPCAVNIYSENGAYFVELTDGSFAYMDTDGNLLGPAQGY